jgi:Tol biopolymer transport system component
MVRDAFVYGEVGIMRRTIVSSIFLLGLLMACNTPNPKETRSTQNSIVNEKSLIAYPARRNDRWDLHIVDVETGHDRIITESVDNVLPDFDWAPDGSQIVFTTGTGYIYDHELFLVNVLSGEITRLTNNEEMDESPDWSPDGKWIAFQSSVDADGGSKIWLINPDSRERKTLVNDPSIDDKALNAPLWSPDMSMVSVSGLAGIHPRTVGLLVIDVQSGRVICEIRSEGAEILARTVWASDSRYIAYSSNQNGTYDVYVSSVTDQREQDPTQITQLPGQEVGALWSPDGKKLLFTSYVETDSQPYVQQIYMVDVETLELHPLTEVGSMVGAGWSPGGQKVIIAVVAEDDTNYVGVMNPDGSDLKILEETASEVIWPPKWNPASK